MNVTNISAPDLNMEVLIAMTQQKLLTGSIQVEWVTSGGSQSLPDYILTGSSVIRDTE